METEKKELSSYISDFKSSWNVGVDSILAASKIYADAIRAYPSKAEKAFSDSAPSITQSIWDKLRSIGNGDLNPNAMLVSDVFAKALSRLPIEKQNKIFQGKGFRVVDPKTKVTGFVSFANLTSRQEKIIFDGNGIRTPEEQKKYIAENEIDRHASVPYYVDGMRLIVRRQCTIGIRELESIVKEIRK